MKFNNFGLALGKNLKFYTRTAKGLKIKVRKFLELNPMFVEVTGGKPVGGGGGLFTSPRPPSGIGFKETRNSYFCVTPKNH